MPDRLYQLARPLLFRLDAERAHHLTIGLGAFAGRSSLGRAVVRGWYGAPLDPRLELDAFGLHFANPVGLAAGLDKDGQAIELWGALGFGLIELGTVTPGAGQPGNETPRLQRLIGEQAIVNRMGFNNRGAAQLAARIGARRSQVPLGANLGKAKTTPNEAAADDYEVCLRALWPVADYLVINVSSPNTPGLRDLQAVSALGPILQRVKAVDRSLAETSGQARRPILLKIAPDLADSDLDEVADLAVEMGMDGLIATNTTLRRELLHEKPAIEGGISGRPLSERALAVTRRLYRRLDARLPIVGVGGIMSAEDAYARIRAGARLVQIYSGLIYHGPGLVRSIVKGLLERLERDGLEHIRDAIGADGGG